MAQIKPSVNLPGRPRDTKQKLSPPPDYQGSGTGKALVQVHDGDAATDIADTLAAKGVVKSREAFTDASPEEPKRRDPDRWNIGGRGLMVVDAFAQRWGFEPTAGGKTVWADFGPP